MAPSPSRFHDEEAVVQSAPQSADPFAALFKAIAAQDYEPSGFGINRDDPSLDQDPFFLRAQRWNNTPRSVSMEQEDAPLFTRVTKGGVSIHLAGGRTWTLSAPLHPVFFTDQYIFLTADRGTELAEQADGVFVVRYQELLTSGSQGLSVPVFFLPMPGGGWAENGDQDVEVTEIPHRGLVVFQATDGDRVPFNVDDIAHVIRAEGINFTLALAQANKAFFDDLSKRNDPELIDVYRDLGRSLQQLQLEDRGGASEPSISAMSRFTDALSRLGSIVQKITGRREIALPRGSTAGFGMLYTGYDLDRPGNDVFSMVAPESFLDRVQTTVTKLFGISTAYADEAAQSDLDKQVEDFKARTMYVLSIVAAVVLISVALKETVYRERYKGKSHIKAYGDVIAHSLTFLAQVPGIFAPNLLLFWMDKLGVPEKSRARKFYNATFGMVRRSNNKTPVNEKTLRYGEFLGMGDSANVGIQLFFIVDPMVSWIGKVGGVFWPGLGERAIKAVDPTNKDSMAYKVLETMRNFVAYLTTGPSAYPREIQERFTNELDREVRKQMRAANIDPDDPKNAAEVERRTDALVNERMVKEGLPDKSQHLFDANTVYGGLQGTLGYKAPKGEDPDSFAGVQRAGYLHRALKRAASRAEKLFDEQPSAQANDAYWILRYKLSDLRSPGFTKANESLVAVTGGNADDSVSSVPESWTQTGRSTSQEGGKLAVELFRDEFFTLIGQKSSGEGSKKLKTAEERFNPMVSDGWFGRWQFNKALRKANDALLKHTQLDLGTAMANGDGVAVAYWKQQFEKQLLRQKGLYPDYRDAEFLSTVEKYTEDSFQTLLNNDPQLSSYLSKLDPVERARIEMSVRTDVFAQEYITLTIQKESIGPLSASQPGPTQRIRQMPLVRKSETMTRVLRFGDGFFADARYSRGLWPLIARTMPMADDIVTGTQRSLRSLPVNMTVGFAWYTYMWRAALPFTGYLLNNLLAGPFIRAPWTTTQRIISKQGLKPGSTVKGMFAFMMIGSYATFFGSIPYMLFHSDFKRLTTAISTGAQSAWQLCQALLTGG